MRSNRFNGFTQGRTLVTDALMLSAIALTGCLVCMSSQAQEAAVAPAANNAPLEVQIQNIEQNEGQLYIQVLRGAERFAASGPASAALILPAASPSMTFSFDSLPAGEYAIRVMQDLDGDGELKTNMVGMPQEPWGVSNDAKGRFGPPSWEDAKFAHPAATAHVITLN